MAVAQLVLGVASYALVATGTLGKPDYTLALTLQEIALLLIPFSMGVGYFLFRYMLSQLDPKLPLEEKVKKYFSYALIRGALFEIGFLFCCVAALITSVQLFLWIAPVVFLVFLLVRPTPEAMTTDMRLSQSDSSKLMGS
jgi:hypothetical protein